MSNSGLARLEMSKISTCCHRIIDGPPCICALGDLTDFVDESISSNLQFHQVIQFRIMAYQIYIINSYKGAFTNYVCLGVGRWSAKCLLVFT